MVEQHPGVTGFVHIGHVVEDLEATVRFLSALGLECGEPFTAGGDWVGRIVGLEDVQVEGVMVSLPGGADVFELVRFHSPAAAPHEAAAAANRPGLRHVAFTVDDIHGVVERVRAAGWEPVGEVVDYEGVFALCYVRGPEGLIVELAQRLGDA